MKERDTGQKWVNVLPGEPVVTETSISICFVHFRGLTLDHLDAAWFSLSKQDLTGVNGIWFLDNNTEHSADELTTGLGRYPFWAPGTLHMELNKHGDARKTQSWSVNHVCQWAPGPWIFFMRSDYILSFDCLARLVAERDAMLARGARPFVSGWCWQMAYDREARNIPESVDIEQYDWRTGGMAALLRHPYGFKFHETDQDAGVWLTNKHSMEQAGWMNEGLSSWGYQQSTFQRALRQQASVECVAVQDYLFAHQHHFAPRDFAQAALEYREHGGGL